MSDYIDFGVVFRIADLDSGVFYIGETTNLDRWSKGYLGTGSDKWQNHLRKYPLIDKNPDNPNAHHYKRTILKDGFHSKKELYEAELNEILLYAADIDGKLKITDPLCKNEKTHIQGSCIPCSECGALGVHRKDCSNYKVPSICDECSGTYGNHKKSCSNYTMPVPCSYCRSRTTHKMSCPLSQRVNVKCTKEINCVGSYHYKDCPKYEVNYCPECNGKNGHHYKICSQYRVKGICEECHCTSGAHLKGCSKYESRGEICSECGGKSGHHKKTCSLYKPYPKCIECGAERGHF